MQIPQSWSKARATLAVAAVTAFAWLITTALNLDAVAVIRAGFIPARIGGTIADSGFVPVWLTPLTATLVHSGFLHVAFNLLFLLICGRSVEAILDRRGLVILYLVGAYVSAGTQYLAGPTSIVPGIGASGAISAVIGAYAMLFGRNKVKVANQALATALHVLWLAIAWVGLQLLVGFTLEATGGEAPAIAAHIGGFIAGLALTRPLLLLKWRGA
jgi:membrane associated rhomboid family serine protease